MGVCFLNPYLTRLDEPMSVKKKPQKPLKKTLSNKPRKPVVRTKNIVSFIQEQLSGLGPIEPAKMFDSIWLHYNDEMFGKIVKNVLYFAANSESKQAFIDRKMQNLPDFLPNPSISYYQVPDDVIQDKDMLVEWAKIAINTKTSKKMK